MITDSLMRIENIELMNTTSVVFAIFILIALIFITFSRN